MAQIVHSSNAQVVVKVQAAPANSLSTIAYNTQGRDISVWSKATYSANSPLFTPTSTPQDVVIITGSPTKTVRLVSLYFSSANTLGAGSLTIFLIKRNTRSTGGTIVLDNMVPLDSNDPPATANVGHYTVNATTLGNPVGTLDIRRVAVPANNGTQAGVADEQGVELLNWGGFNTLDDLLTLNTQYESLVINLNGNALLTGQIHRYRVIWTEE